MPVLSFYLGERYKANFLLFSISRSFCNFILASSLIGCHKNAECGLRSAKGGLRSADTENKESQNADTQNVDSQNAESQNEDRQNADSQNAESQNADTQNADSPKND